MAAMNAPAPRLPPSPPNSVGRSSTGTGMYPIANGVGGGRKYSIQAMELDLQEHHRALRDYLNQSLREDRQYQPHNRARDKLLRLSPVQFQELSTDVYDELLRREDERHAVDTASDRPVPRYLMPKNNYHPKRNQARQKLSTLAARKFRELATDVLFELERRVPRLAGDSIDRIVSPTGSAVSYNSRLPPRSSSRLSPAEDGRRPSIASTNPPYSPALFDVNDRNAPGSAGSGGSDFGRPTAKQFQSNTMIPNKGTMVEDDDDQSDDVYSIDGRQSSRRTTSSGPMRVEDSAQTMQLEWRIKELEDQLQKKDGELQSARTEAEALNKSLTEDVDNLRAENARLQAAGSSTEWRSRYEELDKQHQDHQNVTRQVREESSQTLQELRLLAQRHDRDEQEREALIERLSRLEASVDDWRSRYGKVKSQLRNLNASSMRLDTRSDQLDHGFTDPNGLIRDVHVTAFQGTVNELLHLAREKDPHAVFNYMRTLVIALRNIVHDADADADNASSPEYAKLKKRISQAANSLMSTARTFANAKGLSPVSLVDAAASNLTAAVFDLIRVAKIRPSGPDAFDDDDDDDDDDGTAALEQPAV